MRIAIYTDNFFPELSGIADSVITLGRELTKRGHTVAYVAPAFPLKEYSRGGSGIEKDLTPNMIHGMPIYRLPAFRLPGSPNDQQRVAIPTGRTHAAIKNFLPDIIHTQTPFGAGLEALRAAKKFKIPLVGTNHTPVEEFTPLKISMVTWPARRYFAWYYNHCLFMSSPYEGIIKDMREAGLRVRAHAVSNPVPVEKFTPVSTERRSALKQELNLPGPTILYTGRLATEKHVDVIMRALKRLLPQFPSLTLIATGHGAAESSLKSLAEELTIKEHVRFPGFVNADEYPKLYQASEVFAMMSTAETQSLSLMQAYASGIPAVVVRARALPDYTPLGIGFVIEVGDDKALSERISQLLTDETLRTTMGAAATAYVQKFSPPHIAERWEKIYTEAIHARPLPLA
jgi:1,2-diacylglycerol 3-alpha-glucosyltransferase